MKIIMKNTYNKWWFIFLLIIGIYASTTHSYGDVGSLNDDDDMNMSKKVTFESLIESMNGRHSVRRAAANTTMATDTFTSKCIMFSSQFDIFFSWYSSPEL